MNTIPEFIDAMGGPSEFARIIGKGASTASEMKRNRSIPVRYWPAIIEAAASRQVLFEGHPITADVLLRLHTEADAPREAAE